MTAPIEGVTHCPCGAKYWDGDRCHSCGELYRPQDPPPHEHSFWTAGGGWRCDCGATRPRRTGPGV